MIRIITSCALIGAFTVSACKTVSSTNSANANYHAQKEAEIATGTVFAMATLNPTADQTARGEAWFSQDKNGLKVTIMVKNASPGLHGIHIHEKGDCSARDASSAGEHFNPATMGHGAPNPSQFHLGDLGNIMVGKDGNGSLVLNIPVADFHAAYSNWNIIIGKSLVLHSQADDLITQPAGDSGDRIACGVIHKK